MPELPEVETIKRGLTEKIIDKNIIEFFVKDKKILKNSIKKADKIIKNNSFLDIDRIGKLLIFELKNRINNEQYFLLIHLKMTGQLVYQDKDVLLAGGHSLSDKSPMESIGGELPNKYTYVIFSLVDGSKLFFNDIRKFGYLKIVKKDELENIKAGYGIEPLTANFTLENFKKALKGRKTNIKTILLNQKIISGIGNIYADESLFEAGVRPDRKVDTLSEMEIKKIWLAVNKIIKKAIKHQGTTFSDYRGADGKKGGFSQFLQVYGRTGEKCYRCRGGIVEKIKISGRGTHYCNKCQH